MRILVVEDEPNLSAQLKDRLNEEGFIVDLAADGEEGLYFGREYDYDAAVVDLGLPVGIGPRGSFCACVHYGCCLCGNRRRLAVKGKRFCSTTPHHLG